LITILLILATLLLILLIGKIYLGIKFRQQVQQLLFNTTGVSQKTFSHSQLVDLPQPVQRYFTYALQEGQPYIKNVILKHNGQFKTGQSTSWMTIKGLQYFTTETPGFIWKGSTLWFTARDMFMADKGRLIVTLLGLFNIVDGNGDAFNEAELQRWLSESVWFPTNLLPNDALSWVAINDISATLVYKHRQIVINFLVRFNTKGQITQMETQRFMSPNKKETWICKMMQYQLLNNIMVPTSARATWKLPTTNFCYAKFIITSIHYDSLMIF
jgi:hypothetical protein